MRFYSAHMYRNTIDPRRLQRLPPEHVSFAKTVKYGDIVHLYMLRRHPDIVAPPHGHVVFTVNRVKHKWKKISGIRDFEDRLINRALEIHTPEFYDELLRVYIDMPLSTTGKS